MNISYNWLKDLIEIDLTVEETARALTRVGLAVESIHPHADDFVLDIDLTSNRPDCLSHLGVARELAVITGKNMRVLPNAAADIPVPVALASEIISIEDPELCRRFTARIIRGVKIGPSPQWLVERLEAIGERSINNIADITNYVMHELGQPMHAFDLDKLAGNRVIVRRARSGESITTLDEVERELDDSMLAICDAENPVAIAGIMGGVDSSIIDKTVNVLLEVAYFKRENIRATSRVLGLATEASYRFERGVDIQNLQRASERAADLICELAGGQKTEFYDIYPSPQSPNTVRSSDIAASVARLTGMIVKTVECGRILNALGIESSKVGETTIYTSPSWRHDIAIEEDLVEEIARHVGYENIQAELPPAYGAGEYQPDEMRKRVLRQTLADLGFNEAITYSFIDTSNDDVFEIPTGMLDERSKDQYVTLRDSVIEGAVRMRPSLLPGLLDAVRSNFNQKNRSLKLCEIGKVFAANASEDGLPKEAEVLGIIVTGHEQTENIALAAREFDLYDAKGAVEAALDAAGVAPVVFEAAEIKHLQKGQTAKISIGGIKIGTIGRLSEGVAKRYKFKQPVFVSEIDLHAALGASNTDVSYRPLSRFPAITRDVSLVGRKNVTWAAIRAAITDQNFELCRDVQFVDVFEGKGLEPGERSITIRLEYRSDERTLVESEVDAIHERILGILGSDLGLKTRF